MTRVYSHPDPSIVHLVRNRIEHLGVPAVVQGDRLGAALGEVPPIAAWAEVWVPDAAVAKVAPVIAEVTSESAATAETDDWICTTCDEIVESTFSVCWACGSYAPEFA